MANKVNFPHITGTTSHAEILMVIHIIAMATIFALMGMPSPFK